MQVCTWDFASSVAVASPDAQHHQGSALLAAGGLTFWIWRLSKQPQTNKAATRKGKCIMCFKYQMGEVKQIQKYITCTHMHVKNCW